MASLWQIRQECFIGTVFPAMLSASRGCRFAWSMSLYNVSSERRTRRLFGVCRCSRQAGRCSRWRGWSECGSTIYWVEPLLLTTHRKPSASASVQRLKIPDKTLQVTIHWSYPSSNSSSTQYHIQNNHSQWRPPLHHHWEPFPDSPLRSAASSTTSPSTSQNTTTTSKSRPTKSSASLRPPPPSPGRPPSWRTSAGR